MREGSPLADPPANASQVPEGPLADRAADGDRAALEAMFAQFLPPEEPVVDGDFLGTYGVWWFGTRTFAVVTHRRVAALRVRKFGRVTYEDALLEHVSTASVRQPSRLLFYLLLALVLVPTVGAGLALVPFVGPAAIGLVVFGLLLLPVAARLYRAFVKSGLLFWVREGLPVYAYCDRGRLGRANALLRVFGEQRDRFLPGEARLAPPDAGPGEASVTSGTLLQRARAGDREALATMFRQFLPQGDAILSTAFLGTQGFGGIGTHSFGCVTQRRAASLRASTLGEVIFQESLSASVNGGRIHQPSRIWLYVLAAVWTLWPLLYAASAGPAALAALPLTALSLPFVVRAYHGRVKSGVLLVVRESPPNYFFCDRGKLPAANALYRLVTERGHAGAGAAPAPAPALTRPAGRSGAALAVAAGALLLAAGIGVVVWATRGDGGSAGGLFGTDATFEIGSVEIGSIEIETGPIETVPNETPTSAVLEHVPPAIADGCVAEAPVEDGAVEQVRCETPDGTTLVYTQFDSPDSMRATYEVQSGVFVEPDTTPTGWCEDQVAGEGDWTDGGVSAGRLACFEAEGVPWFMWTNDGLVILARGFRTDGDWAAMYEAWLAAGPS